MTEYEKQLVEELDQDYRELVDGMSDLLALDTANLILHYGTDGKKVLDDIIRLIAVASQALRVPMGKVMAKTGMLEESEPNNRPGTANRISLNTWVTGEMTYYDEDWFQFTIPAGRGSNACPP